MNWKAILGAALIVIALSLAGGGVYAVHSLRQPKFDPETLCPLAGAKAVTLILIDKTDPLTATEQARVRSLIAAEAEAVQTGGRIIVKLLQQKEGASEAALATAADLCNPGAEGNPFFENPAARCRPLPKRIPGAGRASARERKKRRFSARLADRTHGPNERRGRPGKPAPQAHPGLRFDGAHAGSLGL